MRKLLSAFRLWRIANIGITASEVRKVDAGWVEQCDRLRRRLGALALHQFNTACDLRDARAKLEAAEARENDLAKLEVKHNCGTVSFQMTVPMHLLTRRDAQLNKSITTKMRDGLLWAAEIEGATKEL